MSIVSIPTYFENQLYYVFATNTRPAYFWQYFSGTFEHLIFPKWFFLMHYLGNFSVVLILGFLVEKVIGMKRILILCLSSGVLVLAAFHIMNNGHYSTMSGTSGIAWSFGPPALFILLNLYKRESMSRSNWAFYALIIFELIFIWIIVSLGSSMETIFWHVLATIVGVIWTFVYRLKIKEGITLLFSEDYLPRLAVTQKMTLSILSLIPISLVVILFMYSTGHLDQIFVEVTSISGTSIEEINTLGKVVITFDENIKENGITSTKSVFDTDVTFSVEYPEEKNTVYILFSETLPADFKGSLEFKGAEFENHKELKKFTIFIE